jgi:hypothetical protein
MKNSIRFIISFLVLLGSDNVIASHTTLHEISTGIEEMSLNEKRIVPLSKIENIDIEDYFDKKFESQKVFLKNKAESKSSNLSDWLEYGDWLLSSFNVSYLSKNKEKNIKDACFWFIRAAKAGDPDSECFLNELNYKILEDFERGEVESAQNLFLDTYKERFLR